MIKQTSIESYYEELDSGRLGERQIKVLKGFRIHGSCTDRELCKLMNISDPNWIRPRRNELVKKGFLVGLGKRKCGVTSKTVIVWGVK